MDPDPVFNKRSKPGWIADPLPTPQISSENIAKDSRRPGELAAKALHYGRLHSHVTVIKAAWEQVAEALWRRYPNPQSKHVLSDDVISRRVEGEKLISKRLLRKTSSAPRWMEMFVGGAGSKAGIVEESIVDLPKKTFTTYTRNINFSKLLSVEEKCVYYVCPENKQWTCCAKQAWIKCGVRGLSRAVEKFGIERYSKNSRKAEIGLEYILGNLSMILNTSGGTRSSSS